MTAAPPSRASGGKALGGSARPAGAQLKFSDDEHMLDTIADDDRKTPAASSGGRALRSRTQAEILELGKALAAAGLTLNDRNLFEHQIQGIQWMLRQERSNDKVCGGLLADDMGLGKTLQGICLILLNTPPNKTNAAALAPTLVMAPVSVMNAWANDMATFAPVLSKQSLKFHGPESSRMDPSDIAQYSLVLTTYDTMKARIETLSSVPWHRIILDEAQNIKNEKTARFEGCMKLSRLAKARWCITGTPLENGPEDVLSLFKFLQVKTYGDSSWFKRHFTMEQQDVAHVMSALTTTTIRRTKEGVNKAAIARTGKPILANKHLRIEMVQLSPAERMAHEDAEMESHALLRLLRGAQAANGTRHDDGKSTKVEGVFGKIAQLFKGYTETFIRERVNAKSETYEQYAKADKIVIFSRFMTTLDMLQEQLDSVFPDVEVLRLDGSTPEQMRHNLVHRFREGKGKMIFLAGLKSGGVGVNLQSAAAVFLVDPWWYVSYCSLESFPHSTREPSLYQLF